MKIAKDYLKKQPQDPHLHSPSHVLADEISAKLGDGRHFGFYLKTALTTDHNVLRKIAGEVAEKPSKNPGALFAFLVKKYNNESDISHGQSIWLMPEPETRERLAQAIKSLAAAYGTPAFDPHLTLISGLDLSQSPEPMGMFSEASQFSVNAGPIATAEEYRKCLYLPIQISKELKAARLLSKKLFAPGLKARYQPHMSIMYGNFKPDAKLEMMRNLTAKFPTEILFDEAWWVRTEGRIQDFKILKKVKLVK
jgi:hypothetical protein